MGNVCLCFLGHNTEATTIHKGAILSLIWKVKLAMIKYTDDTIVNKHPKTAMVSSVTVHSDLV